MTGAVVFLFVVCVVLVLWNVSLQSDANDTRRRLDLLESATSRPIETSLAKRIATLEANQHQLHSDLQKAFVEIGGKATAPSHLRLAGRVDRLGAALHSLFAAADLAAEEMDKQP